MAACPSCGQENPAGARFCQACAALLVAAPAAAHEVRKTVTVVFSDIVDSTPLGERLDPESLRRVMSRYFGEMRAALEAHGGTVEKFIGDAVMAVFGVPTLHEDDALRAVRAASEMRDRLARLNEELRSAYGVELQMRVGINTGPVVAGSAGGPSLATGDAVNLAKRLEQAAGSGEILIGAETYRLVRDCVHAAPLESRAVKGKADTVASWRLESVVAPAAATPKRLSPLVGRELELDVLMAEFERVAAERSSRLVTVLGTAGLGKSRLADEFLDRIGDRSTTLRGQCLPYGDGITYWPLAQMVREIGGEPAIREALEGRSDADLIVDRVLGVTGAAGEAGGGEETSWALRRLFEALATPWPLVLVFEDIHWGEPTLLDLIEYFAGWIRDAPVLILCLARPDVVERQPSWLTPRANASAIPLTPLSPAETDRLLADSDLGPAVRARIADAAEGNPLFVEQMVALLAEEGESGETIPIPPSIQALLAARLDRLTFEERSMLETAAVVGRGFWRGAVRDLAPQGLRNVVGAHLMALVRKDLVEPESSTLAHEDAFRFRHVLIRDAAYEGTPKERRAELHERFAEWIADNVPHRVTEREEITGYHLEQAYRLRAELGPVGEREYALARRAAEILGAAGRRALLRSDMPAATNLLGRAIDLGGEHLPDRPLLLRELSAALWASGDLARAETTLSDALAAALAAGDGRVEWYARLDRSSRRILTDSGAAAELGQVAAEAVNVFGELGDDLGLARAWRGLARVARIGCRFAEVEEAAERALAHAEVAGDSNETAEILDSLFTALLYGPAPAEGASARCAELAAAGGNVFLEANAASSRAGLEAMLGNFEEARALIARAAAIYDELGHRMFRAGLCEVAGPIELLAERPEAAERELRHAFEILAESGDSALLGYPALMLAETLLVQGRDDEARRFVKIGRAAISPEDATDQILARMVAARLRAREGELSSAEAEARAAAALAAETDALVLHADSLALLGDLLARAKRPAEGRAAFEEALELYERKGHAVGAGRMLEAVDHGRLSPA
jgi:predicted ATPase/class 3 adenylate cyclase